MASGSNDDDTDPFSLSRTVETTNPKKMQQFTGTLTSSPPPLPTLTFDLIEEILCMLPVKLLLQLRCLCKSFNSLISDPKFSKKHLRLSTTRHNLMVTYTKNNSSELLLLDSPISSVFFFQLLGLGRHNTFTHSIAIMDTILLCTRGFWTCALVMASFCSLSTIISLFCRTLRLENSTNCLL